MIKSKKKSAIRIRRTSLAIQNALLVNEAAVYEKNGNYNKAIFLYNQVLEMNANDKKALIARSKCHLLLGNARKALDDAEAALRLNLKKSSNTKAIYCKAEALYHLGDFEMSLVYYYRGMKIRPEFDQFRLGVQKARDAIQNVLLHKTT
ncbi:tetratricopeptide repeat protein 25 isoform X2 [Ooceraea biroi]|uniref:tetratricopeptide repeat protein 25 isoform X2 n=1 Tax=Ooceraea biroi TaxID=2015173 RepID=UPI000F0742BE|nr:tetratricopeptide repeat protein 25 isoform X2 [Ooceraea biroi]XP_026830554.1 tetratricopeptide repeat protein 25 isoform X2 [Ooceraea biroi]